MNWLILGKSIIGRSHLANQMECQDYCKYGVVGENSEYLIILVSDGAGSAKYSQVGSKVVCETMYDLISKTILKSEIDQDNLIVLIQEMRSYLQNEVIQTNENFRDYACTMLVAVVGQEKSIFGQIGDGGIVYENNGEYQIAFWPDSGEYVNETSFITDDDFQNHLQFKIVESQLNQIAVFSDGIQNVVLNNLLKIPHASFFKTLFREFRLDVDLASLEQPFEAFLNSDLLNQKTDDDKTLVVAVRSI